MPGEDGLSRRRARRELLVGDLWDPDTNIGPMIDSEG